jgi:hypothetical protein
MSPSLAVTLIAALALMLAAASAVAGALWWRQRSTPLVEAARLARDLAERQKALEALLERLERLEADAGPESDPPPPVAEPPGSPTVRHRFDPPRPDAVRGPTLIAVPDLSATGSAAPPLSAELARRFGDVWALADAGVPAAAIARRTGQPIGQVELILGLRRQVAVGEGRP